ncbi:Prostaglandin E2 receptor EP4 subtype [Mactra antiquata]
MTSEDLADDMTSLMEGLGTNNATHLIGSTNESYSTPTTNATVSLNRDPLISLTVPAIMFASGVIGNLLAICVLSRSSREHKQTVFYRLVGALACTDLFGTCATSPVTLAVYANKLKWVGGKALCDYESFMLIFAGNATICIVGTMAVDRFLAISYPFFYDNHITPGRAKFIIIGLWSFAAFMGILPILGLGENINQFPGSWCFFTFTSSELKNQIFTYFYSIFGLLIIGITAISNVVVTFVLLKMRRKAIRSMNASITRRHDSELQMMILLLGIIVIFSTCWCPFMIRVLINQIHERQVDVIADLHALRLASLNQILDPWIYILFRKELFSRTFKFLKENVFSRCSCFGLQDETRRASANGQRHVPFLKHESDYVHMDEENDYLNRKNSQKCREDENNDIDMGTISSKPASIKRQHSGSSNKKTRTQDEAKCPLVVTDQCLCMKHSACLFCLSNHPKKIVLSAIAESRSMDELHKIYNSDKGTKENVLINHSTCSSLRKDSIHISLGDLSSFRDEHLSRESSVSVQT